MRAGSQQCSEAGDICAICQADFRDPIALLCQVMSLVNSSKGLKSTNSLRVVNANKKSQLNSSVLLPSLVECLTSAEFLTLASNTDGCTGLWSEVCCACLWPHLNVMSHQERI